MPPVEAYRLAALKLGAKEHQNDELWEVMGPKMKSLFEERAKIAGRSSDQIEKEFWETLLSHIVKNFEPCRHISLEQWLNDLRAWFGSAKAWKAYPETQHTLETLKNKGIRIALISNWDSSLENILEELDLKKYFEVCHISAQVGWRKPNPKIFELTLDALQLKPEQTYHVGDNISDDIIGASVCGITPLFVDRWNYENKVDATRIKNLSEILELFW